LFETTVENDERRQTIENAIYALPSEQAEVITMKMWGELTFAQIAEAVGVSANTVASRYRYALTTLRRVLDEETVR
jgi:RNA polymerase sigma-70 factor (ECF subfamily)